MAADAASVIAERYARALFSLAQEQGGMDVLAQDMNDLAAMSSQAEMARFFATPLVDRAKKAHAMAAILEKANASPLARQFIHRLALNNRLPSLVAIAKRFTQMVRAHRGEVDVQITAARPLSSQHLAALQQALAKAYGRTPSLHQATDPALLSGFVLSVGGLRMDYSLSGKLSRLRTALNTSLMNTGA